MNTDLPALMPDPRTHRSAPHLALIAVQMMFGTWPIVGKIALRAVSSTQLVAFRVAGAAIAFSLLQRRLGQLRRLPRRDLRLLVLCSALGVAFNQLLYVKGLSLTTVINVTLLSTAIPVFTLIVSFALGYDRLSLKRVLGILLAAAGVVYLVDPLRADFSSHNTIGNLLIVANSFSYAAYIAISKDLFKRYGALNVITWVFIIAALVNVPVGVLTLSPGQLAGLSGSAWLAIAYTIMVPTVAAYYLNAWALVRVSPSTVSVYIYLQPLIAFGLAPLILRESWNPRSVVACVLIFAGVGLVTRRGRSPAAKEVAQDPDARPLSH